MTWVLHPGGEARYYLSLVQVHDINTAQLWEPGSCSTPMNESQSPAKYSRTFKNGGAAVTALSVSQQTAPQKNKKQKITL